MKKQLPETSSHHINERTPTLKWRKTVSKRHSTDPAPSKTQSKNVPLSNIKTTTNTYQKSKNLQG